MVAKEAVMEAVEVARGVTRRQLDPRLFPTHLTPLEEKLFLGGSIHREGTEGELMSDEEIFQSDKVIRIHPTGGYSVERIARERKGKFIKGYFPIFYSIARVFLPEVHEGRIKPVFRIQLITDEGRVVRGRDISDAVTNGLPPDYQRYFQLRIDETSGELLLEKVLEREPQVTTI